MQMQVGRAGADRKSAFASVGFDFVLAPFWKDSVGLDGRRDGENATSNKFLFLRTACGKGRDWVLRN